MKGIQQQLSCALFGAVMSLTPIEAIAQKLYSVAYAHQAQVKVFVTEYAHQADLLVFKVVYDHQAKGNEGFWHFTDYAHQAHKKIFFVDHAHQADLKVHFVSHQHQASWRNNGLKHLLY